MNNVIDDFYMHYCIDIQKYKLNNTATAVRSTATIEDFQILQEIGRGATSIVYKVKHSKTSNIYALKLINTSHCKHKATLWKEVCLLKAIEHPHSVQYYYSFIHQQHLAILMEYAPNGDLSKLIKERIQKKLYLFESEVWKLVYEMFLGILHLHSLSIIHRDIKPLTCLLYTSPSPRDS